MSFFFGLDETGDLGLWKGHKKIWSSQVLTGMAGDSAVLQKDGNLVLLNEEQLPLWDSRTNGPADSNSVLKIEDNGVASIINHSANTLLSILPLAIDSNDDCKTEISIENLFLPGDKICSNNGIFTFGLSFDGELSIRHGPIEVWSAGVCCDPSTFGRLQRDGNFVVRTSQRVVWASRTSGPLFSNAKATLSNTGQLHILNKDGGKELLIDPNEATPISFQTISYTKPVTTTCVRQVYGRMQLSIGEFICSSRFRFGISLDGNLGLFEGDYEIWSLKTQCSGNCAHLRLQNDGNLVVFDGKSKLIWRSRTHGPENLRSSLSLKDSGTLAITNRFGKRIWAVAPAPKKSQCLEMTEGRIIVHEGNFICSRDAKFRFGVFDGDLSLWQYNQLTWSAGTSRGWAMIMRRSGSLAVIDVSNREVWGTSTGGNEGSSLVLENDGIPTVVDSNGNIVWSTTMHTESPEIEFSND